MSIPRPAYLPIIACLLCAAPIAAAAAQEAPADPGPASFDERFRIARDLAISGERDAAIAAYSALLEASPGNADVLLGRGRVHAWEGRWPEAEADLVAATRAAPDYGDAWSGLGDMYLWSDRPAQAAEAYARWAALDPDAPEPRAARARALRAVAEAAAPGPSPADRAAASEAGGPAGERWSAALSASVVDAGRDDDTWHEHALSLRRHGDRGSIAIEALQAHRFGLTDRALALDAYVDAWARAYANLRYQDGGGLFPDRAWRVELFQGVGSGWELSASHDRLVFGNSDTRIHGAGIGYYWGNFYARAKVTHVPDETGDSTGVRGQLRWYYAGNADDYLQVAGGTGRSVEELAQRGSAARVRSNSGSVAWVRYFGDWGMRLGASYADDEGIGRIEKGATVSVYRRW